MQKAIFLLTQRGPELWRDSYIFEPYNWGPYCRDLADDLRGLEHHNLLRLSSAGGAGHGRYVLTPEGQHIATRLWRACTEAERRFFADVRAYVTSRDFNGLLRDVYSAYPAYAERSVWSGRR